MELFLPSLFIVVIAALLAFVIIPRMGSMILAITSLIALILAGYHHYNLFYSEYQLSTWQNGIGANAPFFILGLAILFIIGAVFYMFTGGVASVANIANIGNVKNMLPNTSPFEEIQNAVQNSIANMPPANTATNPVTEVFNTGLRNIVGNIGPVANNRGANNKPANKNNKSLIPNLGFRASEI